MKNNTFIEKELRRLTSKARFNMSIQDFNELMSELFKHERQIERQKINNYCVGNNSDYICKNKVYLLWRKGLTLMCLISIIWCLYFWCGSMYYNMYLFKFLLVFMGTFFLPPIYEFLCGKSYYELCAFKLKKEKGQNYIIKFDWVIIVGFLIFGIIIFPLGIGQKIFNEYVYFLFMMFFGGWSLFHIIYGMWRISFFQMEGVELIYIGNGMIHSLLLLFVWCDLAYQKPLFFLLIGILIIPLPIVLDILLLKHTNHPKGNRLQSES